MIRYIHYIPSPREPAHTRKKDTILLRRVYICVIGVSFVQVACFLDECDLQDFIDEIGLWRTTEKAVLSLNADGIAVDVDNTPQHNADTIVASVDVSYRVFHVHIVFVLRCYLCTTCFRNRVRDLQKQSSSKGSVRQTARFLEIPI